MTLEQTFTLEADRDAARRQAEDLAQKLRIVERQLADKQRMAHMAAAYLASGQFQAAVWVLESL